MKKGNSIKLKIAVIISIIITIFWLLPYIYVICCSFKPGSEVIAVPPSFLPKSFSVENFTQLFVRMNAGGYLLNSLITAVCSTIIAVILGSLAAYAIQRSGAKLSVGLVVLILCLKMIPTSSIAVPISFYEGVPSTLDEAAYVDGASSLQTFRKVILPICKPGLATAFIFTLFLAWNDFLISLLLTSMNAKTFTVGLAGFLSAYNLDLGPMCAGAFLFSFPVMILSMFAQRYIVQGMTAGAVKG